MRIIGITGGVGAGKSEILNYLSEQYHAPVIQADRVAHFLMEPGQVCYGPVTDLLGDSVKAEDGVINRRAMGEKIFGNAALREQINKIIHPAVKEYVRQRIAKAKMQDAKFFIIEAALLIEDDYGAICDELWYIYTSEEVRRERLAASRGYTEAYARQIMSNQLPDAVFRRECDFVIDNNGSMEHTKEQIDRRMQIYETV